MIEVMERLKALQERVAQLERREQQAANLLAWGRANSMFMSLQALVGYWPGVVDKDTTGALEMVDYGTNQLHLSRQTWQGAINGLSPVVNMDGGSDIAYHADSAPLDITGTEVLVESAYNGITCGGWFYSANAAGTLETLMAKAEPGTTVNYKLNRLASGASQFLISNSGTTYAASHTTLAQNTWYFIVGRFDPSTEVSCWVDNSDNTNTTSIPASASTNNDAFCIGGMDDGAAGFQDYWSGQVAYCFLCAAYLPDSILTALYRATAPMFK